jgi:hypothetical protein
MTTLGCITTSSTYSKGSKFPIIQTGQPTVPVWNLFTQRSWKLEKQVLQVEGKEGREWEEKWEERRSLQIIQLAEQLLKGIRGNRGNREGIREN